MQKQFSWDYSLDLQHQQKSALIMTDENRVKLLVAIGKQLCCGRVTIYHCDREPVSSTTFGTGFVNLPWVCPKCQQIVQDYDDLKFDIQIVPGTCFVRIGEHFVCKDRVFEVASVDFSKSAKAVTTCGNTFYFDQFEFCAK